MSSNLTLSRGIRLALSTAATASVAHTPAVAADAPAAKDTTLQEVVVTGSRIRRVDIETANPVFVIDQAAIQQSGVQTVGDLVSRIPSVAGAATSPAVNNGGGYGEQTIELRGLDAKRTLILVDGRRIGLVGTTSDATDVNQIPLAMIERVEVLKEGAGAIYGSDAVGGVVNFITRKDIEGLEISADYGRTSRSDGQHHQVSMTFGTTTDNFNFVVGGSVMKQDAVSAGDRDFSKFALYLYGGTTGSSLGAGIIKGGSSRTPTGRIFLPAFDANGDVVPGSLADQYGCGSVTRVAGAGGTQLADYRCFAGAPDRFNYQPLNLDLTPQEHSAIFSKLNYHVNDYADVYASIIANRTHSGYQIAPLPFDAQVDDVTISKDNIYNPFGNDFGGISGDNPNFLLRMSALGNRRSDTVSEGRVINAGVKGKLMETGWNYDLNFGYSHLGQLGTTSGYLFKSLLGPALGPSFVDGTGPHCGTPAVGNTPANIISGCIPLNFFNPTDPANIAALNSVSAFYNVNNTYRFKAAALDLNGKVLDLPAGELQASVGIEYSDRQGSYVADSIVQATPPLYLTCQISNEACTGNTFGGYNSKQFYLELYAPLLKDLPAVHLLSLDVGVRYSDYSLFGNATKADVKLEYRPVSDLLFRGTFSQVFRVPTVSDLYASPVNTSVTFIDPCTGLTSAQLTANPNLALACQGVAPNTGFAEPNGQITGLNLSNPTLKPETGTVKTFGFIYEPRQLANFSAEVDYWKYEIHDLITLLDSNYSITQCIATGAPAFCSLINRYTSGPASGQILVFQNPTFNLGELSTDGVDLALRYALKDTRAGSFQFTLDLTRINSYKNTPAPGAAPQEIVGTYNRQFGNYAKYRGIFSVGWAMRGFDALVSARYIHSLSLNNPAVCPYVGYSCFLAATDPAYAAANNPADFPAWPALKLSSVTYVDATLGYSFKTKTKVQAGVRNLTDKQPPLLYQNNVTNANTNVETYDTIGRAWWMSFSQKF